MGERLQPASLPVLRDAVLETLVEAIISGRFPAGSRLHEAEIARQLGVSKTPVREALVRLGRLGLVVHRPRRGTFVAEVGPDTVRDIFTLRWLIEGYVTAEATRRATAGQLAVLDDILARLAAAEQVAQWTTVSDLDVLFHERIYAMSAHPLFLEVWCSFEDQVRLWHRLGRRLGRQPAPWTIAQLHQEILAAIRSGDLAQAEAAAREHIDRASLVLGVGPIALTTPSTPPHDRFPPKGGHHTPW